MLSLARSARQRHAQRVAYRAQRSFRAWVVDADKGKLKSREVKHFEHVRELPQPDPDATVTVDVKYSDLNYKDAMIFQGQHGVVRRFPLVPGIDCAGLVASSTSELWQRGDAVVLTGNKIGQHSDGGYSEQCRVQAEWLAPKPESLTLEESMIIGTAGFTAMQMVLELQDAGLQPGPAPVLVLGAAGGAGSMAVAILAQLGYKVVASSRRAESLSSYFQELGAFDVIGALERNPKPLQDQRWSAVLDCAGSPSLGTALAQLQYQGACACIGVAGAQHVEASLYPFVLRGIRLIGVDATLPWNVPGYPGDVATWRRDREKRLEIWRRLDELKLHQALRTMHEATIPLEELPQWCEMPGMKGTGIHVWYCNVLCVVYSMLFLANAPRIYLEWLLQETSACWIED
ncbi:unnamed protein product [Durusdinium trenchii]|uniref:Enoyl reductase (ER) domain-containing protein n=1 Tax=Durusdinium trenchii TaxID=1381693 RepID=A0ABP0SV64_9DINO